MKTAVVTDGKYRSSIAAVRALGRAGYRVVVTQTREDTTAEPPVFASRFAAERRWIDGGCADAAYPDRLLALLGEYERPVLLCVGAATLGRVSAERTRFAEVCDVLAAPPAVLDALNDKEIVHARAETLGIPVPREYGGVPERYPVVIKPHCGEKFGLKAKDRYAVAENESDFREKLAAMRRYDPAPLVQEKVVGAGAGVSLLLDREHRLVAALCHRRIREYPVTGGPSTCCESFYDRDMIADAYSLLRSFDFEGLAMVEFKGAYVLEVNPRIWGSFPMTECAGSDMTVRYARAAAGETLEYLPQDYRVGARMRFLLNDTAAILACFRAGRAGEGFAGLADAFRAKEALRCPGDNAVFRKYLKNNLLRR